MIDFTPTYLRYHPTLGKVKSASWISQRSRCEVKLLILPLAFLSVGYHQHGNAPAENGSCRLTYRLGVSLQGELAFIMRWKYNFSTYLPLWGIKVGRPSLGSLGTFVWALLCFTVVLLMLLSPATSRVGFCVGFLGQRRRHGHRSHASRFTDRLFLKRRAGGKLLDNLPIG